MGENTSLVEISYSKLKNIEGRGHRERVADVVQQFRGRCINFDKDTTFRFSSAGGAIGNGEWKNIKIITMEKLVELTNNGLKRIGVGWMWVARAVAAWAITQTIDGVIDGLDRPC